MKVQMFIRREDGVASLLIPDNSSLSKIFRPVPGLRRRILILGAGTLAVDLCGVLAVNRRWLRDVIGVLDQDPGKVGQAVGNLSIIGTYGQLLELVETYDIHTLVVCLDDRRAILPVQSLLELKAAGVEVVDGHQLYEEEAGRLSIDLLRPSALIFSTGFRRRKSAMAAKRLVDIVGSVLGLILTLPVIVFVAVLIKLDSIGPVFYRQVRVGLGGKPYMIWKFRSMCHDAEKNGPRWAQESDPRVSRVGKWLRKLRIDEVPQFINVLKGEMSLVGPRPERPVFVQELREKIPYYDIRHTVRPGITGWAQTQFRYGASAEDSHAKLQYDLYYVKNLSFSLDVRALVETIRVVLLGAGAR